MKNLNELIEEILINEYDNEALISMHNQFCEQNKWDNEIISLDENTINDFFSNKTTSEILETGIDLECDYARYNDTYDTFDCFNADEVLDYVYISEISSEVEEYMEDMEDMEDIETLSDKELEEKIIEAIYDIYEE